MKGDNSRFTFAANKNYRKVLMQQGRGQTDADWNEQAEINDYLQRTEARDLIGGCCAPKQGGGFKIGETASQQDLTISPGRIYVDGVLCELHSSSVPVTFLDSQNEVIELPYLTVDGHDLKIDQWVELYDEQNRENVFPTQIVDVLVGVRQVRFADSIPSSLRNAGEPRFRRMVTYLTQPDYIDAANRDGVGQARHYLAYLDVWQRHITALEDPDIREIALGGPDTTTRSRTISQVKLFPISPDNEVPSCSDATPDWKTHVAAGTGQLAARARPTDSEDDPCILPPNAGFTRLSNQLYRVEIHRGSDDPQGPSFKWSRENGSLAFRIEELVGGQPTDRVRVAHLGMDDLLGLHAEQWVEISDDHHDLAGVPGILTKITAIDPAERILTLSDSVSGIAMDAHPKVRRWDMENGEIPISIPADNDGFLALEDGVEVRFDSGQFRAGDYWCIPARTAIGDVQWPRDSSGTPIPQRPDGIEHRYCKLAIVELNDGWRVIDDCRHEFPTLCELNSDPAQETGFHVIDLRLQREDANGAMIRLVNDMFVTPTELASGIEIICDDMVSRESVLGDQRWNPDNPDSVLGKPVVSVVLDLPFPLDNRGDLFPEPDDLIGFQPLTLFGRVDAFGERIVWNPFGPALNWLDHTGLDNSLTNIYRLFGFMQSTGSIFARPRILAHLTVKGSFIWAERPDEQGELRYLDGNAFGRIGKSHTDLVFPSGDRTRGGDFEMWFWVVPEPPREPVILLEAITVLENRVIAGRPFTAEVVLVEPAPGNGVTVNLSSDNTTLVSMPSSIRVPGGQQSVQFRMRANPVAGRLPAAVTVTLTATAGESVVQDTVRVVRQ